MIEGGIFNSTKSTRQLPRINGVLSGAPPISRAHKPPSAAFHITLLGLSLKGVTLVVQSLATAYAKFKFYMAAPKIQFKGNDRETLGLGLHAKLLNLLSMDKQLAVSARIMIEAVAELIHGNVHPAHVEFIPQYSTVRPGKRSLTVTHNLNLGPGQLNTALDPVEYGIVVPSLAVYGKITGRRVFLLRHVLFVISVHGAKRGMLGPLRLRIFGASYRIEIDFGDELAFRDFTKCGIDLVLIRRKGTHQRLFAVDELLFALRDEIHENGHRRYAFMGFLQEFDIHFYYSTSEKEARIVSNAAFSVKEYGLHLEGFLIQHRQVGCIALLNLAERIAKTKLNRLVP